MFVKKSLLVGVIGCVLGFNVPSAEANSARETIEQRTLANGLDVILVSTPTVPIVTVELCVKNGAFTEPPELNGLSHLYEHMFFKGNDVIPDQEAYLKRMRELGIVFNGTTGTERVNYYFTLPTDRLREGLVFMKDAITTLRFDEVEFAKEKQVVIGEVDRNESSPYHWFRQAMSQRLWHAHPSRKDSLGDRKTVLGATVEQMKAMKARYYVPNNAALVISGNVGGADAFAVAEEIFGGWERGADPFAGDPIPKHPPIQPGASFVLHKEVQVPVVMFSWHGPSVGSDPRSTYASDVL
ncbi:MAG: pitrilysin family protein, partial [Myxococcota bacterium]|nr:pitrilysin family protein [Myxococcota bacterium]